MNVPGIELLSSIQRKINSKKKELKEKWAKRPKHCTGLSNPHLGKYQQPPSEVFPVLTEACTRLDVHGA